MKKILVIGISIISVFILCSLSYQPIIADEQIEQEFIQIIGNSIIEDDCDCLRYRVICNLLELIYFSLSLYCYFIYDLFGFDPPLSMLIIGLLWGIGNNLGCDFAIIPK